MWDKLERAPEILRTAKYWRSFYAHLSLCREINEHPIFNDVEFDCLAFLQIATYRTIGCLNINSRRESAFYLGWREALFGSHEIKLGYHVPIKWNWLCNPDVNATRVAVDRIFSNIH